MRDPAIRLHIRYSRRTGGRWAVEDVDGAGGRPPRSGSPLATAASPQSWWRPSFLDLAIVPREGDGRDTERDEPPGTHSGRLVDAASAVRS
jgi:hypothetical protein